VVLHRHRVNYWLCGACGYVQTDAPTWLEEAYSDAIAASDVGLVARNIQYAAVTDSLVRRCFDASGSFVDYGGGYGLLVRLLRDEGLDFRLWDPRCANLFAKGFEASAPDRPCHELVTAFEVFEHLVHPLDEVKAMLKFSRRIFFSTRLLPEPAPAPGSWWYYCHETGQHVGLFSRRSLENLARTLGLHFTTDGISLHLLSDAPMPAWKFKLVTRYRFARMAHVLGRRKSLLPADYERIISSAPGR
jgi:hypothetical protein